MQQDEKRDPAKPTDSTVDGNYLTPTTEPARHRPRGFAAIDPTVRVAIASKGGKAAHAQGTAHKFSSEEARAAGKKGGAAPHSRRGRLPRSSELPTLAPPALISSLPPECA